MAQAIESSPRMMAHLRHEVLLAAVAMQFLTRWPIRLPVHLARGGSTAWDESWLSSCVRHFPGVGGLVGLAVGLVAWGAVQLWPPAVASLLAVAAGIWWTGAFHEDGLADTADALGGHVDRDRALAIMKDSRIGTYGAMALILVTGLRVACVAALLALSPAIACAACVWIHALARWVSVAVMAALPYGGDAQHAKAKPLALGVPVRQAWMAALWLLPAGMPIALLGQEGLALASSGACAALLAIGLRRWVVRRLGGYTGDTLGAAEQVAEAAVGLALIAVLAVQR